MTTEIATQSGVNNEVIDQEILDANAESAESESTVEHEAGERPETDRERIIREISERRHAEMTQKETEFTEEAGDQPGIEDRFQKEEQPSMVKIKVDGKERMVPTSEVVEQGIRAMQKESAADKRLQEAAERSQEVELRAQQVNEFARQLQAEQERIQGQTLSREDAIDVKQQARQFIELFVKGDEEAAVEALSGMIGRGNAIPDPRAMLEQATLAAREEVRKAEDIRSQHEATRIHAAARVQFDEAYKEIIADPMLYRMTNQESLQVAADHPEWDVQRDVGKILMEAGKRVSERFGKPTVTSKQERKRGLPKPLSGASGRLAGASEYKQKTGAEIVADQRRARGLAVY